MCVHIRSTRMHIPPYVQMAVSWFLSSGHNTTSCPAQKESTDETRRQTCDRRTDRQALLPSRGPRRTRTQKKRACRKKKKKDDMKKAKTRSWSFLRPMSGRGAFARRVVFSGRSRLRRTSFVCLSVCYTLLSRLHILPPSAPGVLHPATGRTFGAPNRPSSR